MVTTVKWVKRDWSDEEREVVRRDYAQTNASAQAIANRLGRTLASKGEASPP